MKKYVSKQDVEKGLVDPHKPLTEQKEYLDKIEKEEKDKHQHKEKNEQHNNNRRERENRPKYNWNKRDVTEDTPIPDAPKKEVPKPDKDKFHEQLNALKKQIDELNENKSRLFNDLKYALKNTSENKKNTQIVRSKYSIILKQKFNQKKILEEELKILDEKKEEIKKEFNQCKTKIASLKKPENFQDCSAEQLKRRLQKTEHKLLTDELDKKQQNRINMKILQIKRAIQKARSQVEINAEFSKLQDNNDILQRQLKDIKAEIGKKYAQLKQVRAQIGKVKEEESNEKTQPEDTRTHEQIRADYNEKIQQVNRDKTAIKQKIEKLKQAYNKSVDAYEDYSDLMAYIRMIKEEKQKIKQWKEEQERRKKEREEIQRQKQKEQEQRQRRRKQKEQRQQERRKQIQERKEKLQKERQEYISRNPHQDKIDFCQTLIDYCQRLRPENADKRLQKRQQKVIQQITDLKPADNKDWQKQLKKGAQVIVSKKLKEQQQSPKKVQKQKKKKQKEGAEVTQGFTHYFEITEMFDTIKVLPPLGVADIDSTIKQINQRIEIFSKPTQEQINAYKVKAAKEFDERHGLGNQDKGRKAHHYREKGEGDEQHKQTESPQVNQKPRSRKAQKKEIKASELDFPGLN